MQIIFNNLPHPLPWLAFLWLASFSSKLLEQQDGHWHLQIFRHRFYYFGNLRWKREFCSLTQILGLSVMWSSVGESWWPGLCWPLLGQWVTRPRLEQGMGISPPWIARTETTANGFSKENWADTSRRWGKREWIGKTTDAHYIYLTYSTW